MSSELLADRAHLIQPSRMSQKTFRARDGLGLSFCCQLCGLQSRVVPIGTVKELRGRLSGFLSGWHDLLAANLHEARGVLDGILTDRIRFEPVVEERQYRLTVPIAFDRVVEAAVPELHGFTRNGGVPTVRQLEPDVGSVARGDSLLRGA